jgi:uncharacterized membrane protein YeiH
MQSPPLASLSQALTAIEVAAILAFAISGLLAAARARLDAVGVCVVAGITAFGGGTLRDVLLDRRPFFWVEHAGWLWGLLLLCVAAILFLRARHFDFTERAIQWADAAGLGLFTASGTQIAIDAGMPAIVAVLMGVVTAVFGGVLRDIVCNEIPSAFRDHRPYAACSFCGGWALVAALALGAPGWVALLAAAASATLLRARARHRVHDSAVDARHDAARLVRLAVPRVAPVRQTPAPRRSAGRRGRHLPMGEACRGKLGRTAVRQRFQTRTFRPLVAMTAFDQLRQ